jgi:hypothetical protein
MSIGPIGSEREPDDFPSYMNTEQTTKVVATHMPGWHERQLARPPPSSPPPTSSVWSSRRRGEPRATGDILPSTTPGPRGGTMTAPTTLRYTYSDGSAIALHGIG